MGFQNIFYIFAKILIFKFCIFMETEEIYYKLMKIGDNYEASVRGVTREELENETIVLKNAFITLYEECQELEEMNERDTYKLKEDNERLRKMVQQIYEAFKKKALKYIVNSKMDTEDLNLFKEIFNTYLK